jgi:hypothetical protein
MGLYKPSPRSHLFTVRLRLERVGDDPARWRGKAQHVLSGETCYFQDWPKLIDFLLKHLADESGDEPDRMSR